MRYTLNLIYKNNLISGVQITWMKHLWIPQF